MPALNKRKSVKKISPDELRRKLKLKHIYAKKKLKEKHPHVEKYLKEKGIDPAKIRQHSGKVISAGALTGALILTPGEKLKSFPAVSDLIPNLHILDATVDIKSSEKQVVQALGAILPERTRPLSRNEEKVIEQVLEQMIGIKAKANLEGEHLNTSYGYIGLEQHLRRYPGDRLSSHGEGGVLKEGMASGLGAWGYFASSEKKMTESLEETEKWHAVVQTLYLPDWNTRTKYLRDWYKYRKVLIVNTENGNAVVASIADSGPAAWTGKHFGGSPEVMDHLGGPRYTKGPAVLFFVDDPKNEIPLGPVEYGKIIPNRLVVSS